MCGIVGYAGGKCAVEVLVNTLKKLEYRGYDSAGIAVFENGKAKCVKSKGRISCLEEKLKQEKPSGNVGIGHTRWATHGEVNDVNSHPHTCGRVTVVHNGIIENYAMLKKTLEKEGDTFLSQTDSEVIAHLIDKYYTSDPVEAVKRAVAELKGSYAFTVMIEGFCEKLLSVRYGSPLVIGVGENETFVSSDPGAILGYTSKYYILDENEIAITDSNGVEFFDFDGNKKSHKKLHFAKCDIDESEKGEYPHFMLKEIFQQPQTLEKLISSQLKNGISGIFKKEIQNTENIKRLAVIGCGSAYNAGLLGKYVIEKLARVRTEVYAASEFRYCDPILNTGDAVFVISQSGETADSLAALRLAKAKNIPVYAVVNVAESSIAREADSVIFTDSGRETAVATTKAYTAQLASLYLLALRLAWERKNVSDSCAEYLIGEFKKIPECTEKMLSEEKMSVYKTLALRNKDKHDIFIIGRGRDYALACEGAMKIKEISYMHCEAYAAGELKHGTISLIAEDIPCIALLTDTSLTDKTVNNIKEIRARGGEIICLLPENSRETELCDLEIKLPKCDTLFMPITAAVALQLYAYYTALYKGCDIDKPRNLAKSVTVE